MPLSAVKPRAAARWAASACGQPETMRWISGSGSQRIGLVAAGAANRSRHLADRDRKARELQRPARAKGGAGQIVGIQEGIDDAARLRHVRVGRD